MKEENNFEQPSEMDKLYAEAEAKHQKALELDASMRQGYDAIEAGGIEVLESHTSPEGERFDVENKVFKIGYPAIDTCALAYLFLEADRQNLNALREHFNIDTSRAHSAVTDTEDCRYVFYNIIEQTARNSS